MKAVSGAELSPFFTKAYCFQFTPRMLSTRPGPFAGTLGTLGAGLGSSKSLGSGVGCDFLRKRVILFLVGRVK